MRDTPKVIAAMHLSWGTLPIQKVKILIPSLPADGEPREMWLRRDNTLIGNRKIQPLAVSGDG